MKKLILILIMGLGTLASATTYTEFYVQTTGNNLFSGHTPDNAATYGTTGANFTNNTSATVCTLYKSGLGAAATAVTNGAWAAVFPDGATTNGFIGMVITNDATQDTIQISLTAKGGSVPASSTAGTSFNVGGAWAGPNTNLANSDNCFPFMMLAGTMTNSSGNVPRANFKSATYYVTNGWTIASAGPMWFQGYSVTPGDRLGKATFEGGTTATTFVNTINASASFADLVFNHNGAAGNQVGISISAGSEFYRVVASNMRRAAFVAGAGSRFIECEAFGNNTQNLANHGGWVDSATDVLIRCISHDNYGSGSIGFGGAGGPIVFINCIAYNNGRDGFYSSGSQITMIGCNSYSNGASGLDLAKSTAGSALIENCNFFKNKTYGISSSGSPNRIGSIRSCVFGSGTSQTNLSGNIAASVSAGILGGIDTQNIITYPADLTPWVDPTNSNFTLISTVTTNRANGQGSFTQSTVNSPTNTVSFPDIGASQYASTNAASGGEHSHVFAQ